MPESDPSSTPDIDAIVVAAREDRTAFGQLYEAYYERILGYCVRRLSQRAAGEDVCGEVFLFVARKMRNFRGNTEQDFKRWVYRIATNEINTYLRLSLRRRELWDKALEQNRIHVRDSVNESEFNQSVDCQNIHHAIKQLDDREQTIVTLRLMENESHDEIAKILGVRPGTIRVAYSRALKKLRKLLKSEMDQSNESLPDETKT